MTDQVIALGLGRAASNRFRGRPSLVSVLCCREAALGADFFGGFALMALHNVLGPGVGIRIGGGTPTVRPERLVGGVGNSIPLIESLICRKPSFSVAKMPLAESSGSVTGV